MVVSNLLKDAGIAYKVMTAKKERPLHGLEKTEFSGICPDSERLKSGELYIAVEGLHFDGHDYLDKIAQKGACAAVVSEGYAFRHKENNYDFPLIVVENTRVASSFLFAAFYGNPQRKMQMIGITGTNGKTSVSRLLHRILSGAGKKCGVIGTVGCFTHKGEIHVPSAVASANMTTPDPEQLYQILALMAEQGVETVVMEVTSHALALHKTDPISFEMGIFTNLTEDHLDFHGDMDHYYGEKAKLFKQCKRAVINVDDRYGRRLALEKPCKLYTCSAEGRNASYSVEDIHLKGSKGLEYKISSLTMRMRVRSPLSGGFNVINTAEAAIVAKHLGVSVREIQAALCSFSGVEGRLERLKLPIDTDLSVYIDYAHTPDALENLLRTVHSFRSKGQRIVVLFGCGGDRERQKRPIMGKIATSLADFAVITSDNCRSERPSDIINDILAGVDPECGYIVIEDRKSAIEYVIQNAHRGDIILLCGKGHEEYEIDRNGKKPFSEKAIVYSAIEKCRIV